MAKTSMERLICSDSGLGLLDEKMARSFSRAKSVSGNKALVTRWQRDWLRVGPPASCTTVECLAEAFSARTALLDAVAGTQEAEASWNGHYVRFFDGKEDRNRASLLLVGLRGNRVSISGFASWLGGGARSGQVNTGEISTDGAIRHGTVRFDSDGCEGELRLTPDGVRVESESGCGGLNVSFVGTYRRR